MHGIIMITRREEAKAMEWLTAVRKAIDFMEEHLTEDISAQDVAECVYISPFFLQRGFSVLTGCGISEYLRGRRLYLSALDLINSEDKVIDIAMRYCYDTPESFTKAFTRFHGSSPSDIRKGIGSIRSFLPMKINIRIEGGSNMEFRIEKKESFKVIGFRRTFSNDTSYADIPAFWDEIREKYLSGVWSGKAPGNEIEQAAVDNGIGEFGVCIDDLGADRFNYMIAGEYKGGAVPEGMEVYEVRQADWAVFDCKGPMPESLQSVNTKIWSEWLPGNPEFELCGNAVIEWNGDGDTSSEDYRSAIWIPVKRKA